MFVDKCNTFVVFVHFRNLGVGGNFVLVYQNYQSSCNQMITNDIIHIMQTYFYSFWESFISLSILLNILQAFELKTRFKSKTIFIKFQQRKSYLSRLPCQHLFQTLTYCVLGTLVLIHKIFEWFCTGFQQKTLNLSISKIKQSFLYKSLTGKFTYHFQNVYPD